MLHLPSGIPERPDSPCVAQADGITTVRRTSSGLAALADPVLVNDAGRPAGSREPGARATGSRGAGAGAGAGIVPGVGAAVALLGLWWRLPPGGGCIEGAEPAPDAAATGDR